MSQNSIVNKVQGAIFLALVIIIWVASAVLIRSIFISETTNFNKPLFLTYFSTAFFMVYLLPVVYDVLRARCRA